MPESLHLPWSTAGVVAILLLIPARASAGGDGGAEGGGDGGLQAGLDRTQQDAGLQAPRSPDGGQAIAGALECLSKTAWPEPIAQTRLEIQKLVAPRSAAVTLHLEGLSTINERELWQLVGLAEPPSGLFSLDEAALLLVRLRSTGLFSSVGETLSEGPGAPAPSSSRMEIQVKEYPRLQRVEVRGLREGRVEDLLGQMFVVPGDRDEDHGFSFHFHMVEGGGSLDVHDDPDACAVEPPEAWLARPQDEGVAPGIVWGGVANALQRGLDWLQGRGYLLATLSAHLDLATGVLAVEVQEGRVDQVQLRGVSQSIQDRVRALLDLSPGQPLLVSDLEAGFDRVHEAYPFLSPDDRHELRARSPFISEAAGVGGAIYSSQTSPPQGREPAASHDIQWRWNPSWRTAPWRWLRVNSPTHVHGSIKGDSDDDGDDGDDADDPDEGSRFSADGGLHHALRHGHDHRHDALEGADLEGNALVLWFKTSNLAHVDVDWAEVIRHTQVTSFAPGLAAAFKLDDPSDRVNLRLDAQLNVNTHLSSQEAPGGSDLLEKVGAQEKVDWLVGPSVSLPQLKIAEVGAQFHTLNDTADRWRMAPIDSYLGSVVNDRPDSEYFRRTGVDAFVTADLAEHLLLGGEYRFDRYDSLTPLGHVWNLFERGEAAAANPEIDAGEWGSLLGRVELSTRTVHPRDVGNRYRDPERSLVNSCDNLYDGCDLPTETAFKTVDTLEVANPSLGGTGSFTRLVSDNDLYVATSDDSGITARVRGAGGVDLPLQKMEGLGGWEDLRGYGFKEFRGDKSVLASVEYRYDLIGAFVDLGTVHQPEGWLAPRLGIGATLNFGRSIHLDVAWRTDDRAELAPDLRLVFVRTF